MGDPMHTKTPKSALAAAQAHSTAFRKRRFLNWFPLGLTYATFYMGRYNFNVVKGMMGNMFHLDKVEMGVIATAGFWTYAISVMFVGPLADRLGGRKAIIFGGIGTALLNLLIGTLFLGGWGTKIIVGMSLLYSVNMFFQSFGSMSVVKVNASWFHVRERGVFGGIFGAMISLGYMFAMTVGGWILSYLPWTMIYFIPCMAILTMTLIDYFLVYDQPSQTGHSDFDVGDAASGESDEAPVDFSYVAKKVFTNPIILTIAAAEFCTGFVRQGLLLYFVEFLKEVHHVDLASWQFAVASGGITVGGILGGLLCGWMSDKVFGSRRAPVAFLFYMMQVVALLALGFAPGAWAASFLIGFCCMWIFGVHGMLSGTASMDFGGRKAAATAAGLLDGVQYVASGFTGFGLGWILKTYGWDGVASTGHAAADAHVWVFSIIPFSVLGGLIIARLWNAHPSKGTAH
jgi:OPA family glycerol-3-phosphate transporter-like MFS transporter